MILCLMDTEFISCIFTSRNPLSSSDSLIPSSTGWRGKQLMQLQMFSLHFKNIVL